MGRTQSRNNLNVTMWCGQLLNWDSVLRVATPQGSALGLLLLLIYVNDIPGIEIHAARVCVATCCIDIDRMMNCLICCGSSYSICYSILPSIYV